MEKLSQSSWVVQSQETNRKSFWDALPFARGGPFERMLGLDRCVSTRRGDAGSWRHSWAADVHCCRAEGHCRDRARLVAAVCGERWITVSWFGHSVSEGSDYSLILIVPSAQPFKVASNWRDDMQSSFTEGKEELLMKLQIYSKKKKIFAPAKLVTMMLRCSKHI